MATFEQDITQAIHEAVRKRVQAAVEEELNNAVNSVISRIKGEVDSIALSVLKRYDVSTGIQSICITVKKELT